MGLFGYGSVLPVLRIFGIWDVKECGHKCLPSVLAWVDTMLMMHGYRYLGKHIEPAPAFKFFTASTRAPETKSSATSGVDFVCSGSCPPGCDGFVAGVCRSLSSLIPAVEG